MARSRISADSTKRARPRTARRAWIMLLVPGLLATWVGTSPPTNSAFAASTTLYVDGGATSLSSNCSFPTKPCSTIGAALAQASKNHAITTLDIAGTHTNFNGVYCEQITIDRSLTLRAWVTPAHKGNPAIDGGHSSSNCPGMPAQSLVTVGKPDQTAVKVTLVNLNIQGGDASHNVPAHGDTYRTPGRGGGIFVYPQALLKLVNSMVTNNNACYGGTSGEKCTGSSANAYGGGIYDDGSVTLTNSIVQYDAACLGFCNGYGGGIFVNHGSFLTVSGGSLLTGDVAVPFCDTFGPCSDVAGYGGAIFSFGTVAVSGSRVNGNFACRYDACTGNGGGIDSEGSLRLENTSMVQNLACYAGDTQCVGFGGGIYADSPNPTTLVNSSLLDNNACYNCGGGTGDMGAGFGKGGGIYDFGDGVVSLTGATLSGNSACSGGLSDSECNGSGGGIFSAAGPLVLTNSTVTQNIACGGSGTACQGAGGAIFAGRKLTLTDSTISDNSACQLDNHDPCSGSGGGIGNGTKITLSNTILASNHDTESSPNCSTKLTDGKPNGSNTVGHNIIGDTTGCTFSHPAASDKLNVAHSGLAGLSDNGGPTQTMALISGSPAIANGDAGTCALTSIHDAGGGTDPGPAGQDQRGEPRPSKTCDIGAYQRIPDVYVSLQGSDGNNCATAKPIIGRAGAGPCLDISRGLKFAAVGGTVHVATGTYCALGNITRSVKVIGAGSGTIFDGGAGAGNPCAFWSGNYVALVVSPAGHSAVTLAALTIQNGDAFHDGAGGGIVVGSGVTLTVSSSTIKNNVACSSSACFADGLGGGIYNGLQGGGTVHVVNSTISGNTGCEAPCPGNSYPHGGGIYNTATLTLKDSTVSGNTGIAGGHGAGGGIANWGTGVATLTNSTVSNNTACKPTGGNDACSGGGIEDAAPLTLVNSTVAENLVCAPSGKASCTPYGGGIDNYGSQGSVSLSNTIVAKNFDTPGKPGTSPDCENPVTDGKPDPANPNTVAGNNLIGNNSGCDTSALTSHDQVGSPGKAIDPKLDPNGLHANGGDTLTIALKANSPAIGKGDPSTCRLAKISGGSPGPNGFDQRGDPRKAQARNACDVGAYDTGG